MRISRLFPILSPQIGHCSQKGLDAGSVSFQTQPALLPDLLNHGQGPSYSAASLDWPLKSFYQYFRCTYCSIPATVHPYHPLYAFQSCSESSLPLVMNSEEKLLISDHSYLYYFGAQNMLSFQMQYEQLWLAFSTSLKLVPFFEMEIQNSRGRLKGKPKACVVDN